MKEIDSDSAFHYWLRSAKPGEKALYYSGFLMRDREVFIRAGGFADNFPGPIKAAIAAWKAFLNDEVRLVQKKEDAFEYSYIAIKV